MDYYIHGNLFYRNKIKNIYNMKDISEKRGTVLHFSLKVWSKGRQTNSQMYCVQFVAISHILKPLLKLLRERVKGENIILVFYYENSFNFVDALKYFKGFKDTNTM